MWDLVIGLNPAIGKIALGKKRYFINEKGDLEESPNQFFGLSGINDLIENWDKLNLNVIGKKHPENVAFLKKNRERIFIDKILVLPAGIEVFDSYKKIRFLFESGRQKKLKNHPRRGSFLCLFLFESDNCHSQSAVLTKVQTCTFGSNIHYPTTTYDLFAGQVVLVIHIYNFDNSHFNLLPLLRGLFVNISILFLYEKNEYSIFLKRKFGGRKNDHKSEMI